jgi:hypothetical protein
MRRCPYIYRIRAIAGLGGMYNAHSLWRGDHPTQQARHKAARRAARGAAVGDVDAVDAVHGPKPGAVEVATVCTGAADNVVV